MPDGSSLPPDPAEVTWMTFGHREEIAAARTTMDDLVWAPAAVAWLQVVAPRSVPRAGADPEGVAAHLLLFATEARYWTRLCVLFDRRHLSDRWEAPA